MLTGTAVASRLGRLRRARGGGCGPAALADRPIVLLGILLPALGCVSPGLQLGGAWVEVGDGAVGRLRGVTVAAQGEVARLVALACGLGSGV